MKKKKGVAFIVLLFIVVSLLLFPNHEKIQKIISKNLLGLNDDELITVDVETKSYKDDILYMFAQFISNDENNKIKQIECLDDNLIINASSQGKSKIAVDFTVTTNKTYKTYKITTTKGNVIEKQIGTAPVESITLNHNSIILGVAGKIQLTAKIEPKNADIRVEWTSSDIDIATVSDTGLVTRVDIGQATIKCKALDGSDVEAICDGEMVDAYSIYTKADLEAIKNNLSASYIVMDNIDLSGDEWTSITGTFSGKLEGNGHTISGLTGQPLFDRLRDATIKNLKFENVNIYDGSKVDFLGCVAGRCGNAGYGATFENCCIVSGTVASKSGGGFMGSGDGCTFKNCYSMINVSDPTNSGAPCGFMRRI